MSFALSPTAGSSAPDGKPDDASVPPSRLPRFEELEEFWNEFASRNGRESFKSRFPQEIQSLARHQRDFPHKSPSLLLRALELKVLLAFRHEFPEASLCHALSRLRAIAENPSFR